VTEPTQPLDDGTVSDDLDLVVSGGLSPDHIGPGPYEQLVSRLRSHADRYLDAVRQRYLGAGFDPMSMSNLHLPQLLEVIADAAPDAVRATVADLLRHLDGALLIADQASDQEALRRALPEDTVNTLARLDLQRRSLRALLEREG
jgi:hypothetical protein